jgi:hypothetical protein
MLTQDRGRPEAKLVFWRDESKRHVESHHHEKDIKQTGRYALTVPSIGSMIHVGLEVSSGIAPVPVSSSPIICRVRKCPSFEDKKS